MTFQRLRFVITGAKGFIGSVFSIRALERGHAVVALDDESRGLNPIEKLIGSHYRVHDCMQGIMPACEAADVETADVVAHFAAATGSLERPLDELRAFNVEMTQHVYADALSLGAKVFLWPTTSLAIGVPDSPYVQSKEEGLAKLKEVDAKAQISVPLRFFNVAGAYRGLSELRKNEVHVLPAMLDAYRTGTPFVINGDDYGTSDGTPSRDFVNVVDVVDYLITIAEHKVTTGQLPPYASWNPAPIRPARDGAIWLGKGHSTTVKQLIALFEQTVGPVQTRVGPRRAFDCEELRCDPDQIAQFEAVMDGLVPARVSIRDELEALLNHYASQVVSGEVEVKQEQEVTVT